MTAEEICAGDTLGRYELLVPIAKGGTAEVWAARLKGPRGFEKIVAIKVMLAEFLDDIDAESMFFDEARLVSRIKNRHVAEVLDLGEQDNALFLVMEWVDGEQLNVVAREARHHGGFPIAMIVRIIQQACSGLQAAHELTDNDGKLVGLVHRDVSPQNILVGYDGTVKVIDFGVAKATSNLQRTNVGQLKGKVAYMAPEQALGARVDRRTDIFALGLVFYQLVTGKHPLRGDNEFATLARIRDKEPVAPPSVHLRSVPPSIEQVILKALAKSPNDRFDSMLDFARALEEAWPTMGDGTEELAGFMRQLLAHRGEKKRLAIREAIRVADENGPSPNSVPAAFDLSKSYETDDVRSFTALDLNNMFPEMSRSASPPSSKSGKAPVPGAPDDPQGDASKAASPPPATSPQPAPRSSIGPSSAKAKSRFSIADFDTIDAIIKLRRRRPSATLIVAALVLVAVLALAFWGISGDSSDPETPSGGPPPKKPW